MSSADTLSTWCVKHGMPTPVNEKVNVSDRGAGCCVEVEG